MIWKNNLLKALRSDYIKMLSEKYGTDESKHLLDILIEFFFGYTKVRMALDPDIRLSESEILKLHTAVKELLTNKPVQYITGNSRFMDLNLSVNESVLIPRPETEELVNLIIQNEKTESLDVIDIGTGSGCIALALQKHLSGPKITAIDISKEALALAKSNSTKNELEINFRQVDILKRDALKSLQMFDIVVSNPPYVTESDKMHMQKNVLDHEPHSALFVRDKDALQFYKAILEFCLTHLRDGGRIYLEINELQGDNVLQLFNDYGFQEGKLHSDIHGKDRFATAIKKL